MHGDSCELREEQRERGGVGRKGSTWMVLAVVCGSSWLGAGINV